MKIKVFRDKYEDALERKVNEFLSSKSIRMIGIQPVLSDGEMMVVVTYE